jgi:hypothetical protein
MSTQSRTQINDYMAHIEETWRHLNTLFDDLAATDGWGQKHGPDWTFADVPYHLAYCNQEILIRSLKAGADEQELLSDVAALNAWNARKFAERPDGQTAAQSVALWRETCEEIHQLAAGMTDADLEKPFWMILYAGWNTVREGFEFTRSHELGEFMQLRSHMGREEPVPSAGVTQAYLQRMMGYFPMFFNKAAAGDRHFTAVMAFTDPGVSGYTLEVSDGTPNMRLGEAPVADLVMTQSAESFMKTLTGMHDPAEAIASGEIQVNSFESLAEFGKLFPMG